ncbi:UNVERIFIED_CONTAM: hypothetical protein FKN15_043563 [Acipenser sinensis]
MLPSVLRSSCCGTLNALMQRSTVRGHQCLYTPRCFNTLGASESRCTRCPQCFAALGASVPQSLGALGALMPLSASAPFGASEPCCTQ